MADFRSRQRVQIHDGTNEFGVLVTRPIFVSLSDGTDSAVIDASGNVSVILAANSGVDIGDVDILSVPAPLNVTGGGTEAAALRVTIANDSTGVVSIDDNGGSITVDGTVTTTNSANSVDDSAFVIATDDVTGIGFLADETTPDSLDEGDIGIPRMTLDRKILTRIVGATDANRLDIDGSGHAQIDLAAVSVTAVPISATAAVNTELNPIFVQVVDTVTSGEEVQDFDTATAVAKDATDNHDYTVVGTTFLLKSVIVSASGAQKIEVQTGPVASLVTKAVIFTSGAKPTEQVDFSPAIEVPVTSTGTVRLIRRNDDNQAMDVYSTIIGNDI